VTSWKYDIQFDLMRSNYSLLYHITVFEFIHVQGRRQKKNFQRG